MLSASLALGTISNGNRPFTRNPASSAHSAANAHAAATRTREAPSRPPGRSWFQQFFCCQPSPAQARRERVGFKFRLSSLFLIFCLVLCCLAPLTVAATEDDVDLEEDGSRPVSSGRPRHSRPSNLPYPFGTPSSAICDYYASQGIFLHRCHAIDTGKSRYLFLVWHLQR